MEKQKYYKIVQRVGRKLYSWQYYTLPEELRMQYYINRPTVAKVGGLLVFDNLLTAQNHCPTYCSLYRCTCREEVILPRYRDGLTSVSEFRGNCWNRKRWTQASLVNSFLWPYDTKAFKVVTLRELVR